MKNVLLKWYALLKDSVFPLFCLGCKKEGSLLCEACYLTTDTSGVSVCPVCHIPAEGGKPCDTCVSSTVLTSHLAVGVFEDTNLLGKLIHAHKYNFVADALVVFERMIEDFFEKNKNQYKNIDLVVPVPLHRRRFAERGFNQAEEIGNIVAKILNVPLENMLVRSRSTKQQAKLGKQDRLKNVGAAFALKQGIDVGAKNILLIDDVFTTGSTLNECGQVLHQNGAGEVHAFTLARG